MSDIVWAVVAVLVVGSGFATAAYLGVKGHPFLAFVALMVVGSIHISSTPDQRVATPSSAGTTANR